MGSRCLADALGFLTARLRRSWGIAFARAHAQHRLSRVRYVGLTRAQSQRRLMANPEELHAEEVRGVGLATQRAFCERYVQRAATHGRPWRV